MRAIASLHTSEVCKHFIQEVLTYRDAMDACQRGLQAPLPLYPSKGILTLQQSHWEDHTQATESFLSRLPAKFFLGISVTLWYLYFPSQ